MLRILVSPISQSETGILKVLVKDGIHVEGELRLTLGDMYTVSLISSD